MRRGGPTNGRMNEREQIESLALSIFGTTRNTAAATQNEEIEPIAKHNGISLTCRTAQHDIFNNLFGKIVKSSLGASVNPSTCVVGKEASYGLHDFWGNFFGEVVARDVDTGADVGDFS